MNRNNNFSGFEFNNVFPFYIRNVNSLFFATHDEGLDDIKSQKSNKNDAKLLNLEFLLDRNNVKNNINLILNKIVSITGASKNEFFKKQGIDSYQNNLYLKESVNKNLQSVLGNVHDDMLFSYSMEFDDNNYLSDIAEGIDLSFYLDHETRHITGGFVWRSFGVNKVKKNIVNTYYFLNLVNTFLQTQIFPLNMPSLLSIFKSEKALFEEYKSKWFQLLESSYDLTSSDPEIQYINTNKTKFFETFLILIFVMIHILEQIDEYFTCDNAASLLEEQNKKLSLIHNDDQNQIEDLRCLINYLNQETDINTIRTQGNQSYYKFDNYTIALPIEFYELTLNEQQVFLDINELIKNKNLSSILAVLLFPNSFGLGNDNLFQMNYQTLVDLIEENKQNDELNFIEQNKKAQLEEALCEMNFWYMSLIKNNKVIILKNPTEESNSATEKVHYYYFWAQIYLQSKIIELKDIENFTNYLFRSNQKWKIVTFRKLICDLHSLDFNENDHFNGIPQIKHIVSQIDAKDSFHDNLKSLTLRVKNEDEIYKRQGERLSIVLAFVVALVIGYIDFFACVFSVAPCSYGNITWQWILFSIGVATFFAIINTIILATTLAYLIIRRKKLRDVEKRKDANIYFGYTSLQTLGADGSDKKGKEIIGWKVKFMGNKRFFAPNTSSEPKQTTVESI
ncbi:hypothetical protein [Ureaplasma ceti]|uniref:Uncharacterized protein n=1 Tax=Ureaplasma ceti TaxID=3119530 RepID=A0ABP9U4T1_9BACT